LNGKRILPSDSHAYAIVARPAVRSSEVSVTRYEIKIAEFVIVFYFCLPVYRSNGLKEKDKKITIKNKWLRLSLK
jgi:hypothetical protein